MNDDFGSYKDAIWKGLTAKELGVVMIAVFCCGGVSVVLYFMLQWNLYVSFTARYGNQKVAFQL